MNPRIVIVGAGFAGSRAAQELGRRGWRATVVDPSPWFEWLPNVHELISGVRSAADLRLPHARLLRAAGHRFVRQAAARIDAAAGRVWLASGKALPFDVCLVAAGGVHHTAGVPGADRFALPFKSVAHCELIGRRLRALAAGGRHGSVVLVGGGLEGIEALGEILRRYRRRPRFDITLVEAAARLLPGAPAALDATLRGHCEALGVRLETGHAVTEVRPSRLILRRGEVVPFDLCIWTGGAAPPPLLAASDLRRGRRGWAKVSDTLQSPGHPNVFVLGDDAQLPTPISKQAYFALQMGEHAAENVDRLLNGRPLLPYEPSAKPMLVTFGDLDTFLVFGDNALAGTGLAAAKEAVYQLTMGQLDPPTSAAAVERLGKRLARGLATAVPALTMPERLLRLPRVRVL